MRRGLAAAVLMTGLTLGLAACEGGGDPVQQALREASAAHQAAATKTTAEAEATPSAPTGDQVYVEQAISEHRAAIARAEASLRETSDPALRLLAQTTIDTRKAEIAALQAWRPQMIDCDLTVAFGSYAGGIDAALHTRITEYLDADPRMRRTVERPWGREGERTICGFATTRDVTPDLISDLQKLIAEHGVSTSWTEVSPGSKWFPAEE
jgi:hypothetical protein